MGKDLTVQIVASVVAGIVLLAIQPGWFKRPDSSRSADAGSLNSKSRGNQAVVQENSVQGDLTIDQRVTDNSQTTTIKNNVNDASGASPSDDVWEKIILCVIAGVVASGLFVLYRPVLQGFSYGMVFAVVIIFVVAAFRAHRLKQWSTRATLVTIIASGSTVVTWVTWAGINSLKRDGISIGTITAEIGSPSVEQNMGGIAGYFEFFTGSVVPVILDSERPVAVFVIFLLLAAVISAVLTVFAWISLLDWHAFLKSLSPLQRSDRVVARANSFTAGRGYGLIFSAILFAVLAVGCAQGYAFDLWHRG